MVSGSSGRHPSRRDLQAESWKQRNEGVRGRGGGLVSAENSAPRLGRSSQPWSHLVLLVFDCSLKHGDPLLLLLGVDLDGAPGSLGVHPCLEEALGVVDFVLLGGARREERGKECVGCKSVYLSTAAKFPLIRVLLPPSLSFHFPFLSPLHPGIP